MSLQDTYMIFTPPNCNYVSKSSVEISSTESVAATKTKVTLKLHLKSPVAALNCLWMRVKSLVETVHVFVRDVFLFFTS